MNRQKKEIQKAQQRALLDITPIDAFFGQYRFLSNFYPAVVKFEGIVFTSTEAAYQAAKSLDPADWKRLSSMTAAESKKAGQELALREDWDEVKLDIMLDLLRQKFSKNLFWQRLQATAPRFLVEGNNWHDTFWGVCNGCKKVGPHSPYGENWLGQWLMRIRDGV